MYGQDTGCDTWLGNCDNSNKAHEDNSEKKLSYKNNLWVTGRRR